MVLSYAIFFNETINTKLGTAIPIFVLNCSSCKIVMHAKMIKMRNENNKHEIGNCSLHFCAELIKIVMRAEYNFTQ